jgi:putative oxidoreductase
MTAQTLTSDATLRPRTALHVSLWGAQVLLAAMFGFAGFTKLTGPMSELATMMPWTAAVGEPLTRFIGTSELLGAIGLLVPSLFRIQPKLSALAAAGLTTVMVLASLFHLSRGEYAVIPVNVVLGSIAAFIAWGRTYGRPIPARA